MSNHTRGPWHQGVGNGHGAIFADVEGARRRMEDGGTTLYPIAGVIHGWNKEEDESNGRLIAAAPCLLEALESVYCRWDKHDEADSPEMGQMIRDALTKARGGF